MTRRASGRGCTSSGSRRPRSRRTGSISTCGWRQAWPATGLAGDERLAALEAEATRLEALGARRGALLLADGENESCQNMVDVEGNEFCLD